ncbi:MAG: RluA family pseudouridine synthase [Saprospiraceae bacterium]|nr:RluA family pseudouridine synthase [Saprospiraceae bacterium]
MNIHKTYFHLVPQSFQGEVRLRSYVKGLFPYLETGSAVKKAFQKNQILYKGRPGNTGDWVKAGSEIVFNLVFDLPQGTKDTLQIFYEDDSILIVRKPPGISSSGNNRSFQQLLKSHAIPDTDTSLPFPYLIHRLDKDTEGLMIAAKNMKARRLLSEMMEAQSINKHYVLIAEGTMNQDSNFISLDLDGKQAQTEILSIEPLNTKDVTTRVFVKLHTGRTHQIRRHFAAIGHPIIGDRLYNKDGKNFKTGLLLCAYKLIFEHPITQELLKIRMPIPKKIAKYSINSKE